MEYCAPRSIPRSRFLSWPEDDQDAALAWLIDQKTRCGSCGTYTADWLDEEGRQVVPEPYHAETELCLGCRALEEERERVRNADGIKHPSAYKALLRPGPPPEPEEEEVQDSEV